MVDSANNIVGAKINTLGKIYVGILLVIFGGIVLHAPVSVGLSNIWLQYSLLFKSWKEILMIIAGLIAVFLMYQNKQFKVLRDPIILCVMAYTVLHVLLLLYNNQGLASGLAGLAIDLRYLLYFGLVYIALKMYPNYRTMFIKVGIAGAFIVCAFALLQVFVLPYDFLTYLGYNKNTIVPYLVVDKNYAFIRINSTLRGPNPLGAYAVVVLSLVASRVMRYKISKDKWSVVIFFTILIGGLVALWASYSRSALVAMIISVGIIFVACKIKNLSKKAWVVVATVLIVMSAGLFAIRSTSFVSNVLLHDNPSSDSSYSSNQGHSDSIKQGTSQLIHQPLGAGIGSTGSASMLGTHPEIIENQYLFIAHEAGWLGLALFLYIYGLVLYKLWLLRADWLALGVFASGVGLALICLLLPILVDDTVAIIWWGLAAIAMCKKAYN